MDETLLCILRDFEVAKEVGKHLDLLNAEIVETVDAYLNELVSENWMITQLSINDTFFISKPNWILGDNDWLAGFAFEIENNEDDFDYWLNHMLGYSKFPFNVVCSFNGLLQQEHSVDKLHLVDASTKLKAKLLANGFSESTSRGKKVYYFSKPIKFEKQQLIDAFENERPADGISILGDIVRELDDYVPFIDEIVEKFRQ